MLIKCSECPLKSHCVGVKNGNCNKYEPYSYSIYCGDGGAIGAVIAKDMVLHQIG